MYRTVALIENIMLHIYIYNIYMIYALLYSKYTGYTSRDPLRSLPPPIDHQKLWTVLWQKGMHGALESFEFNETQIRSLQRHWKSYMKSGLFYTILHYTYCTTCFSQGEVKFGIKTVTLTVFPVTGARYWASRCSWSTRGRCP